MLRSATPVLRSSVRSPIVARAPFQPLRQPMRMQTTTVAASPVHSHTPMWIVLGVLVGGGASLFYYVKPIRELASKAHASLEATKDAGSQASSFASQAASMAGLGPAFGISQLAYKKIQEAGGISTFFEGLSEDVRNSDVAGALNKIKSVGGKEVEPYIAKAEKALKDAGGKASDVDWKSVLDGLKEEVGDEFKGVISFITNYVPSSGPIVAALATGDFSKISEKIKAEGGDQLKELEATAKKLYTKAQAATKDGKGSLEDVMKSLKDADGEDLDKVVKQVKDLAKKAGIPADTIESWIAAKGGKLDTDALVKKAQSYASAGQSAVDHFDTDKVISSVKVVSPSLASLLALGLSAGGLKLGSAGEGAAKGGKEQYEQAKKQLTTLTEGLKSSTGGVSKDLQDRLATLQKDLEKTINAAPSLSSTADAAKDSASKGKVTGDAESKKEDWEAAVKKLQADSKKAIEGAMKDVEKAVKDGKAGESGKTVLELVKKYVSN